MMLEQIFESKKAKEFDHLLLQNGFDGTTKQLLEKTCMHGIILAILTAIGASFFVQETAWQFFAIVAAFFLPTATTIFFNYYFFDSKRKKMESLLPDLLLQASLFPKGTSLAEMVQYFSKTGNGALSEEFKKCDEEIKKGASPEHAFSNMKKRIKSKTVDRALDLLLAGAKSGNDTQTLFRQAASDLLETNALLRERAASLIIQKYTLLFAGGLIVPIVLGITAGLLQELDFSSLAEIGIGLSGTQKKELFDVALLANQIYLVEYALIASFFVAFQESDRKKTIVYAAFLVPLSLIAFGLAQSF